MKKRASFLLALCLVFGTVVLTFPAGVSAAGLTSFDLTLNYTDANVNNGVVNNRNTVTLSTVTKDGMSVRKLVPDPTGSDASQLIALDHYMYKSRNLDLASLKSISFYCYYEGSTTFDKPRLNILPGTSGALSATAANIADAVPAKGQWTWVRFDVSAAIAAKLGEGGGVLEQFHFYPYGTTRPNALTTSDVAYIAKIRLTTNESAGVGEVLLSFCPGRPDVTGEAPMADTLVHVGDTVTLPPNTYAREGYTFASYVSSINQFYYYEPGDVFTVPDLSTGVGMAGAPAHLYFLPTFTKNETPFEGCEKTKSVAYTDWFSSVNSLRVNGEAYAAATRDVIFDGRRTLCVEPLRDCAAPRNLVLDSYNWAALPWNLDYYKYATVDYYFETSNNILSSYKPQLSLLSSDGTLPSAQVVTAKETVAANRWAVLNFDLSHVSVGSGVEYGFHILKQVHFAWQPNTANVTQFSEGTKLYIGNITLFHELPEQKPELVRSYMNGDPDGSFRPHDKLTKAESAQLLYNLLKLYSVYDLPANAVSPFSDVTDTSLWYYQSVATLAALGVIPPADAFLPAAPVTRRDFAVCVQNALHLLNASSIAGTALFGSGDTLTREEAAVILNRLVFGELGRESAQDMIDSARVTRFKDVHPQIWSYPDIIAATAPRLSYFRNGQETLLALLTDSISPSVDPDKCDTSAGNAKVLEVDALTDSRIAAIRATPNIVTPANVTTGTVYYLSTSSGSTSSPGTSPSAPRKIKLLSDVNTKVGSATIQSGDVLLFKRGDTFRGQLTCVSGVTYSAYGTGAKPVFNRNTVTGVSDAANWALDYENAATGAKIWKYTANTEISDIGAIFLMNGSDITAACKEIPDYYDGWFVRGTSRTVPFDYKTELDHDLEFVSLAPPAASGVQGNATKGPIYLRCDAGNPASVYSQIEINIAGHCVRVSKENNVTIDNLCIRFFGGHGISASTVQDLTVTNCEIGWGGGAIQYFGADGVAVRFGNGVEVYGGCRNYTVDNCYVYQMYDAGITHQIAGAAVGSYYMENVRFTNNVLEYSTYNIEYFNSPETANDTTERFMKDISYDGNIVRKAGYGWGVQRPDPAPSNIKGWNNTNNKAAGFTITNNIVDRTYNAVRGAGSSDWLGQLGTGFVGCEPYLEDNVFIQVPGRQFLQYAKTNYLYGPTLPAVAASIGAQDNEFYYCSEGTEEITLSNIYHGVMR